MKIISKFYYAASKISCQFKPLNLQEMVLKWISGFLNLGYFSTLNLNNDKHPYIADIYILIIDKLRCVHDSAY